MLEHTPSLKLAGSDLRAVGWPARGANAFVEQRLEGPQVHSLSTL